MLSPLLGIADRRDNSLPNAGEIPKSNKLKRDNMTVNKPTNPYASEPKAFRMMGSKANCNRT